MKFKSKIIVAVAAVVITLLGFNLMISQATVELANAGAATYSFDNLPFGVYITEVVVKKNAVNSGTDTLGVLTDVDGGTGSVALFTATDMGLANAVTQMNVAWSATQALLVAGANIDVVTGGAGGNRGCTVIIKGLRAADV